MTPGFDAQVVAALPGPAWLREARLAAWERFASSELPTESEEIWRYSRIDDLQLERYRPCQPGEEVPLRALPQQVQDLVIGAGERATVVLSHNGGAAGVLRPQQGLAVAPAGDQASGAADGGALVLAGPRADIWTALNAALAGVPWRAKVAEGAQLDGPLVVVHWLDAEGAAVFPRLEVEVGPHASVEVLEVVASSDVGPLVVPMTVLEVGAGATLGFGQVQLLGRRAWQLGNQVSRVGRDATLRSMTLALGGDYARVRTDSVLEGPGGRSELLAAYFGAGSQMHDLRTVQQHAAPQARSDLLFKGVVANQAHSVYSGLIRVEKGARGTNAFQTNRNLVLSEGARADSVPNLEIEDNDVRCSHASAVGPIDESQRFYLESRGVPAPAAERLIAMGFLDDVLERFPVHGLLAWLRSAVAAKVGSAGLGDADGWGGAA
jgi:Fe-S cluster assembly protein SufD